MAEASLIFWGIMLTITSHETPADCEGLIDGWNELLDGCVRPNPFYSPEMLLTAWDCYGNSRVRVLTAWDRDALVGLLPIRTEFNFNLFPVIHTKAWRYRHCYSCMPLLANDYEEQVMRVLLDHLSGAGRMFSIYDFPLEDSIGNVIGGGASREEGIYLGGHERACLRPARAGRKPFQTLIRTKRLKEYRRQKKLLEKQGALRFTLHRTPDGVRQCLEVFFALERAGWKGRSQTALVSNHSDRRFARTALNRLADSGRLHVYEMSLDGKPLSMLLALHSGREMYMFKIAHDPGYARYSPGVLLIFECSRQWEREAHYSVVDSCATPEHSLVNRLWHERRNMGKLHVSGGDPYTRALVAVRKLGGAEAAAGEAV